ncbi:MAG: cell division protein FtsA [Candidatus Fermentibacter sp.]|nr:cell division protein FtsA [Candidatus Fermentibacter sp.]
MSELLSGLDIGTATVTCVAGEPIEGGGVRMLGAGQAPVDGAVREGMLLDVGAVVEAIHRAVSEAALLCTEDIGSVFVSVSGSHVRGFDGTGTVSVEKPDGDSPHEITEDDVARAEEAARLVRLPPGSRVLDIVKRDYCVDGFDRIRKPPIGLMAEQISARTYTVMADRLAVSNIESAVEAAGLDIEGIIPAALASGAAVLTPDEMEMGVALADMGGGTTDVAVFKNGTLAYLGVVPLGGNSVTSDLQALRIPWAQAEKLKTDWAVASSSLVDPNQSTKVMRLGGRGTFSVSHAVVSQVAGQRVEEILEAVALEISRSGIDAVDLPGGLILTGGGSRLRGIAELAGRITGLPAETGVPTGFETSTELVLAPEFSTAAGLVLLGRERREAAGGRRAGFLGELTKWISGIAGRLR